MPALVRGMTRPAAALARPVDRHRDALSAGLPPVLADANQLETGAAQPGGQRARRHARGRRDHHRRRDEAGDGRPASGAGARAAMSASSVRDTGEGMDEDNAGARHRAVLHHQGRRQGHRPGPVMVHGMAEQSGGRFVLQKPHGRGHHRRDLAARAPAAPPPTVRRRHDGSRAARPRRCTVLAVDDDALVLINTAAMLEDLGHTCSRRLPARRRWPVLRTATGRSGDHRPGDAADDRRAAARRDRGSMARPAGDPGDRLCRTAGRRRAGLPKLDKPFSEALNGARHRRDQLAQPGGTRRQRRGCSNEAFLLKNGST